MLYYQQARRTSCRSRSRPRPRRPRPEPRILSSYMVSASKWGVYMIYDMCVYIYIYINIYLSLSLSIYIYIYLCIYIYICIPRSLSLSLRAERRSRRRRRRRSGRASPTFFAARSPPRATGLARPVSTVSPRVAGQLYIHDTIQ